MIFKRAEVTDLPKIMAINSKVSQQELLKLM
jgi:hypothetical protein